MATAKQVAPSGVVTCPGCTIPMVVKKVSPALASSKLDTYTFRCEKCGTETKRELKHKKS